MCTIDLFQKWQMSGSVLIHDGTSLPINCSRITADPQGPLYVCDYPSNAVHAFSSTDGGRFVGTVLSSRGNRLGMLRAITWNAHLNALIVAHFDRIRRYPDDDGPPSHCTLSVIKVNSRGLNSPPPPDDTAAMTSVPSLSEETAAEVSQESEEGRKSPSGWSNRDESRKSSAVSDTSSEKSSTTWTNDPWKINSHLAKDGDPIVRDASDGRLADTEGDDPWNVVPTSKQRSNSDENDATAEDARREETEDSSQKPTGEDGEKEKDNRSEQEPLSPSGAKTETGEPKPQRTKRRQTRFADRTSDDENEPHVLRGKPIMYNVDNTQSERTKRSASAASTDRASRDLRSHRGRVTPRGRASRGRTVTPGRLQSNLSRGRGSRLDIAPLMDLPVGDVTPADTPGEIWLGGPGDSFNREAAREPPRTSVSPATNSRVKKASSEASAPTAVKRTTAAKRPGPVYVLAESKDSENEQSSSDMELDLDRSETPTVDETPSSSIQPSTCWPQTTLTAASRRVRKSTPGSTSSSSMGAVGRSSRFASTPLLLIPPPSRDVDLRREKVWLDVSVPPPPLVPPPPPPEPPTQAPALPPPVPPNSSSKASVAVRAKPSSGDFPTPKESGRRRLVSYGDSPPSTGNANDGESSAHPLKATRKPAQKSAGSVVSHTGRMAETDFPWVRRKQSTSSSEVTLPGSQSVAESSRTTCDAEAARRRNEQSPEKTRPGIVKYHGPKTIAPTQIQINLAKTTPEKAAEKNVSNRTQRTPPIARKATQNLAAAFEMEREARRKAESHRPVAEHRSRSPPESPPEREDRGKGGSRSARHSSRERDTADRDGSDNGRQRMCDSVGRSAKGPQRRTSPGHWKSNSRTSSEPIDSAHGPRELQSRTGIPTDVVQRSRGVKRRARQTSESSVEGSCGRNQNASGSLRDESGSRDRPGNADRGSAGRYEDERHLHQDNNAQPARFTRNTKQGPAENKDLLRNSTVPRKIARRVSSDSSASSSDASGSPRRTAADAATPSRNYRRRPSTSSSGSYSSDDRDRDRYRHSPERKRVPKSDQAVSKSDQALALEPESRRMDRGRRMVEEQAPIRGGRRYLDQERLPDRRPNPGDHAVSAQRPKLDRRPLVDEDGRSTRQNADHVRNAESTLQISARPQDVDERRRPVDHNSHPGRSDYWRDYVRGPDDKRGTTMSDQAPHRLDPGFSGSRHGQDFDHSQSQRQTAERRSPDKVSPMARDQTRVDEWSLRESQNFNRHVDGTEGQQRFSGVRQTPESGSISRHMGVLDQEENNSQSRRSGQLRLMDQGRVDFPGPARDRDDRQRSDPTRPSHFKPPSNQAQTADLRQTSNSRTMHRDERDATRDAPQGIRSAPTQAGRAADRPTKVLEDRNQYRAARQLPLSAEAFEKAVEDTRQRRPISAPTTSGQSATSGLRQTTSTNVLRRGGQEGFQESPPSSGGVSRKRKPEGGVVRYPGRAGVSQAELEAAVSESRTKHGRFEQQDSDSTSDSDSTPDRQTKDRKRRKFQRPRSPDEPSRSTQQGSRRAPPWEKMKIPDSEAQTDRARTTEARRSSLGGDGIRSRGSEPRDEQGYLRNRSPPPRLPREPAPVHVPSGVPRPVSPPKPSGFRPIDPGNLTRARSPTKQTAISTRHIYSGDAEARTPRTRSAATAVTTPSPGSRAVAQETATRRNFARPAPADDTQSPGAGKCAKNHLTLPIRALTEIHVSLNLKSIFIFNFQQWEQALGRSAEHKVVPR